MGNLTNKLIINYLLHFYIMFLKEIELFFFYNASLLSSPSPVISKTNGAALSTVKRPVAIWTDAEFLKKKVAENRIKIDAIVAEKSNKQLMNVKPSFF